MEPEESFLKRHGFAIAGIALPLIVVLVFVAVRAVPRFLVEDPAYDLLFSTASSYSNQPGNLACDVAAIDGRVRVRWVRAEQPVYGPTLRVQRLTPATGDLAELTLPEPAPGELGVVGEHADYFLPGLDDVRIESDPRAPDGYRFESRYRGGSGLFGEIFGGSSYGPVATIEKNGRVIVLPEVGENAYYGSAVFLGWVVPAASGR